MEAVEYSLEGRDLLRFTYKIIPGVNRIEGYGIKLAEQTNMPKKIIDEAKRIRAALPTVQTYYVSYSLFCLVLLVHCVICAPRSVHFGGQSSI